MRRTLWSMYAVLFLSSCLLAQANQAAMAASPHEVKQGEQVTIQVKVNPAPNVGGRLDVYVAPEGSTSLGVNGGNGVSPGQTSAGDIGITIPIDAKLGHWKVIKVVFQPGSSAQHELTISGNPVFEVVKRDTVLPTSADVQVK
jgi:hypothetical protein